jgi:hypothetical protein
MMKAGDLTEPGNRFRSGLPRAGGGPDRTMLFSLMSQQSQLHISIDPDVAPSHLFPANAGIQNSSSDRSGHTSKQFTVIDGQYVECYLSASKQDLTELCYVECCFSASKQDLTELCEGCYGEGGRPDRTMLFSLMSQQSQLHISIDPAVALSRLFPANAGSRSPSSDRSGHTSKHLTVIDGQYVECCFSASKQDLTELY